MPKHFKGMVAAGAAVTVIMTMAGCASSSNGSAPPSAGKLSMPSSPVTLNLVDVAGDTQVAEPMINAYIRSHPQYLSKVNFETGDATEIVSKLKAQQAAGISQIDIVLTGNDALGLGVNQGVFQKLYPTYKKQLGPSVANYQPGAMKLFQMTQGYATVNDFGDYGPLLEYLPQNVSNPPTTPAQLLDWAKQHPGQFMYADPANSGPGRAFVQGLPYILGDSNPRDPIHGWNKTWAYLEQLGKYIAYYPAGTTDTMQELANGSRKIIASTTGWDINTRALGAVPKDAQVSAFGHTSWIMDSSYVAVPKGISAGHLAVVLDLIKWMLSPQQQAKAYDTGYMYPGPAVKGVTLSMAPKADQNVIHEFGRAEYQSLLSKYPAVPPLSNKALAQMFDKWDRIIGGKKLKS